MAIIHQTTASAVNIYFETHEEFNLLCQIIEDENVFDATFWMGGTPRYISCPKTCDNGQNNTLAILNLLYRAQSITKQNLQVADLPRPPAR